MSRGKSDSQPSSPERCLTHAAKGMLDLVWLEEKAVPRWIHRKFYRPWSGP